jgi:hypothetical protein
VFARIKLLSSQSTHSWQPLPNIPCPLVALTDACRNAAIRSLTGEKRTSRGHSKSVAVDRHFVTVNDCIAKGSLALDVDVSIFCDTDCSLSSVPLDGFDRWRGKTAAGPSHWSTWRRR